MDFLKELFASGALTWEQFTEAAGNKGFKIADLSGGGYISKQRYDDELAEKDKQITALTENLKSRDRDLTALKDKLEKAGKDTEKFIEASEQLKKLQEDYSAKTAEYEKSLADTKYEFAVKDFANGQKFTSAAAKRDFIRNLTDRKLQMENDKILGVSDYFNEYKQNNADSFAADEPDKKPEFVKSTGGAENKEDKPNPFLAAMNYIGVRPEK